MNKQFKFEAKSIILVFITFTLFVLALINFKVDNIVAGIILIAYTIISIGILVKLIKDFKSESPEKKG